MVMTDETRKTAQDNWFEEFKRAYADYPSQDNEGYVPDRGGFKAGFCAAWRFQDRKIAEAVQAERERCAKVVDSWAKEYELSADQTAWKDNPDIVHSLRDRARVLREVSQDIRGQWK